MKTAAHVFISYVEANSSVALAIAQELRQLGHTPWTYEEDGVPGHSYLEQVHSAIHSCDAFVLLASTESLKSHQVRREAETAYEQQKLVIPVRLSVSHDELQNAPIFRMVSGTAVSVATDGKSPHKVAERIAAGLQKAGFQRQAESAAPPRIADAVPQHGPTGRSTTRNRLAKQLQQKKKPLEYALAGLFFATGLLMLFRYFSEQSWAFLLKGAVFIAAGIGLIISLYRRQNADRASR
jgi:hypothetical protein